MYAGLIGAFSINREIVKEIDVYKRERLAGLQVFPYVTSKMCWLLANGFIGIVMVLMRREM